ncbi:permease-like cell division protein FtsX [Micromonosporaceae bacterium B7E4]
MSDMPSQPSAGTPLPAGSSSTVSDRPAPGRHWIVVAVVALAAMLVGALATAATLFAIRDDQPQPQHRYEVRVRLDLAATAEQKTVVESALSTRYPADAIRTESRAEAYERFKELFKDQPDLLESVRPDSLPESLLVVTVGRLFDCAALAAVKGMTGVDGIIVRQLAAVGRPDAVLLNCP